MRARLAALVAGLLITHAAPAAAQTNAQLWGNLTINWLRTERLTYELDFEPKVLLKPQPGEPGWRNLDVTPNVEYSARPWIDLVAEVATGYTKQTDDVETFELSPRVGLRFHLFSRARSPIGPRLREMPPRRRLVVRDLVRVESRNFFSRGPGAESSSTVRFRNRLELLSPLNKEKLTDDGARYVLADWEWFVPMGEPQERFASKQRIRAGLGYRRNVRWRFEALYIWMRSRDTISEAFRTSENIIDIRVKRVF